MITVDWKGTGKGGSNRQTDRQTKRQTETGKERESTCNGRFNYDDDDDVGH